MVQGALGQIGLPEPKAAAARVKAAAAKRSAASIAAPPCHSRLPCIGRGKLGKSPSSC
uniref:Uncharacterized protein n=1 Tax=Arundo donax TaxID=35708 RepID=A0A0A9BSB3_ARUDO